MGEAVKPLRGQRSIRVKQSGQYVATIPLTGNRVYFLKGFRTRARSSYPTDALNYQQILPIIDFFEYKQKDVAQFLDVDSSTISRWKTKGTDIGALRTKAILDVDEIIAKGVRVFGSEDSFKEWLNTTNHALGDQKPIELLKNPYGVEMVEEAIDALSWGVYI